MLEIKTAYLAVFFFCPSGLGAPEIEGVAHSRSAQRKRMTFFCKSLHAVQLWLPDASARRAWSAAWIVLQSAFAFFWDTKPVGGRGDKCFSMSFLFLSKFSPQDRPNRDSVLPSDSGGEAKAPEFTVRTYS